MQDGTHGLIKKTEMTNTLTCNINNTTLQKKIYAPIRPECVYCHLRPNKSYHKPAFISYCIHCNRVTYGLLLILIRTIHFSCCPLVFLSNYKIKVYFYMFNSYHLVCICQNVARKNYGFGLQLSRAFELFIEVR